MSKTTLLINEPPLQLLPSLAKMIGLNEAIVVQQLHYYLSNPKCGVELNGDRWIYNTYAQWQEECFCFWSIDTIKRVFLELESMSLVESCQPDGRESRRKYYRLNRGMMEKLTFENLADEGNLPSSAQLALIEQGNLPSSEQGKLPPSFKTKNPETSTENTPLPPKGGESVDSSSSHETKRTDSLPTTPAALRIAALFSRKKTTEWMPKEIKAFKRLVPIDLDDLALLETYYAFERQKNGDGIQRRDLQTFLNNYYSELDRARAWRANPKAHEKKPANGHSKSPPVCTANAGTTNERVAHLY